MTGKQLDRGIEIQEEFRILCNRKRKLFTDWIDGARDKDKGFPYIIKIQWQHSDDTESVSLRKESMNAVLDIIRKDLDSRLKDLEKEFEEL